MTFQHYQWDDPMPPHHTVQSMSFSLTSVDDNSFFSHCTNTGLSEHMMLVKDQEEKRSTEEELCEINYNPYYQNSNTNMQRYIVDSFSEHQMDLSFSSDPPPPSLLTPEFQYSMLENSSIASSPSLDFISSASPSNDFYTPIPQSSPELPFFPTPVITSKPTHRKQKSSISRTLSYENVMELNIDQPKPSPPPQKPLSHEKVMEALRAKLKRSASPKSKSAPEPIPPPNTNPTTGVLFLDLKHRRRKTAKRHSYRSI